MGRCSDTLDLLLPTIYLEQKKNYIIQLYRSKPPKPHQNAAKISIKPQRSLTHKSHFNIYIWLTVPTVAMPHVPVGWRVRLSKPVAVLDTKKKNSNYNTIQWWQGFYHQSKHHPLTNEKFIIPFILKESSKEEEKWREFYHQSKHHPLTNKKIMKPFILKESGKEEVWFVKAIAKKRNQPKKKQPNNDKGSISKVNNHFIEWLLLTFLW